MFSLDALPFLGQIIIAETKTVEMPSKALHNLPHIMYWMFVSSQNSYAEALTPNVIVFGDGVIGR